LELKDTLKKHFSNAFRSSFPTRLFFSLPKSIISLVYKISLDVLLPPGQGNAEGEAEFPFLLYTAPSEKESSGAFFPRPSLPRC